MTDPMNLSTARFDRILRKFGPCFDAEDGPWPVYATLAKLADAADICGGRPLFDHFAERKLLAHVPAGPNDLLVLSFWSKGSDLRPLTPEERNARLFHPRT